jgi:hypothetical protein
MRTILFTSFDPTSEANKQFVRDLRTFLKMNSDIRLAVLGLTINVLNERTEKGRRDTIEKFSNEKRLPLPEILSAAESCRFLIYALAKDECRDDKSPDLGEDLRELTGLTAQETAAFVETIDKIRSDFLEIYRTTRKKRVYEAGVLPSLKSCGNTVEFRAIIEDRFRFGMVADDYHPRILGYAPVISVHLSTDSGFVDDFSFQASPQEISLLIDNLRAALREAEAFEAHLSIERGSRNDPDVRETHQL